MAHDDSNVAAVFHDYIEGYYSCRSLKRSFYEAFNAVASRLTTKLLKEADKVIMRPFSCHDFDWVERVLYEACGEYWKVSHSGEVSNSEVATDEVVSKYLQ